jgi:hypothetical protein
MAPSLARLQELARDASRRSQCAIEPAIQDAAGRDYSRGCRIVATRVRCVHSRLAADAHANGRRSEISGRQLEVDVHSTVDLARSDAAVRMATRGSHRASRRRADHGLVFALCAGPGVHCAGTARIGPDRRPVIIGRFASAIEPAFPDALDRVVRTGSCALSLLWALRRVSLWRSSTKSTSVLRRASTATTGPTASRDGPADSLDRTRPARVAVSERLAAWAPSPPAVRCRGI